MTDSGRLVLCSASSPVLRDSLESAGIILIPCAESGMPLEVSPVVRLLAKSAPVRQAIRAAIAAWESCGSQDPVSVLPGVVLYPIVAMRRRRARLHSFLMVPTIELTQSEHLHGLLQSAGMDFTLGCKMLAELSPISSSEVDRILTLVRLLVDRDSRGIESAEELEKMSRELSESYEELNLVYSTIRNMTVVEQPDRFVQLALRELHETLTFGWIAVSLLDDVDQLKRLAGRSFFEGDRLRSDSVADFSRHLMALVDPASPLVIERSKSGPFDPPEVLGDSVLVQPICGSEGDLLGIFIAGHKRGDDDRISSADIKLMAATAGHTAIFLENAALYDDLNATILGTLEALTASIDAKDPYTSGHSHRVAHLTRRLAVALDLPEGEVSKAHIAGLVHDVGKIGVPESVLTKPGRLTEEEFGWIRRHPEMGHRILRDIPQFRDLLPGVLHHHERWDGAGYPRGLSGDSIPFIARMICLSDSFDAMCSSRTYRAGMSRDRVIAEIRSCAGHQFDPALVEAFLGIDFSEFDRMLEQHCSELARGGGTAE